MGTARVVAIPGLLLALCSVFAAHADQIYLSANFDDKTVGFPVGEGGAEANEPYGVEHSLADTVRSAPFPTPCLEVFNPDPVEGGFVFFSLLGGTDVVAGLVVIGVELWFPGPIDQSGYRLAVYPLTDWSHRFVEIEFSSSGQAWVGDYNGYSGGSGGVGAYPTGRAFPLVVAFDMDAGTYSVWIDDSQVVTDEPHGVEGFGVGQVLIGMSGPSQGAKFWLDSVGVTDYMFSVPAMPLSWGGMKGLWGE